jgi:virginiamycin B lyase
MTTLFARAAHTFTVLAMMATSALPADAAADARFAFFPVPTPASGPMVNLDGSDGGVWFLEVGAGKIGRLDPDSGAIEEFKIPADDGKHSATRSGAPLASTAPLTTLPAALANAADGNIWFTNGADSRLGNINPKTKRFSFYDVPSPAANLVFNDIYPGPDRALWFTEPVANKVGRFDLTSETITEFPVPTPGAHPVGIFAASDGGIWFTEFVGNKIARIDVMTKQITEFPVPTTRAGPFVVRAESHGSLWFTELLANKIGRIDLATKDIREIPIPTPLANAVATCASKTGEVYFNEANGNNIGRVDPVTNEITEIPVPSHVPKPPGSRPTEIRCGPGNAVWFPQSVSNNIGRLSLG